MTTPEEIEARVSRLEQDVTELRQKLAESGTDAAAARVLASGADRDVSEVRSELRAHTRTLNALRETQAEFGRRLGGVERRLDAVERRLMSLEARFDSLEAEMRAGFAEMRSGMAQIVTLLGGAPPA